MCVAGDSWVDDSDDLPLTYYFNVFEGGFDWGSFPEGQDRLALDHWASSQIKKFSPLEKSLTQKSKSKVRENKARLVF